MAKFSPNLVVRLRKLDELFQEKPDLALKRAADEILNPNQPDKNYKSQVLKMIRKYQKKVSQKAFARFSNRILAMAIIQWRRESNN